MTVASIAKPYVRFLDNSQFDQIHQAALEIIRHTGVRVSHDEALVMLSEAGFIGRRG